MMPGFFLVAATDVTTPRAIRPAALVFAREQENRVAFGYVLAAIHGLLCAERIRPRPWIANFGLDRKCHPSPPDPGGRH
jgi:hypothetical protein